MHILKRLLYSNCEVAHSFFLLVGIDSTVRRTVISGTLFTVWAVGDCSPGEVPIIALVEHWNGTSWSVVSVPSPDIDDSLFGVTHITRTHKLWAVGMASHQINDTLTGSCQ